MNNLIAKHITNPFIKTSLSLVLAIFILFAVITCVMPALNNDAAFAEDVSLEWKSTILNVKNNVNDYSFQIQGDIKYDVESSGYKIRIAMSTLTSKYAYLMLPGYEFKGLKDFALDEDLEYYTAVSSKIDGYCVIAQYKANLNSITFIDSINNGIIQEFQVNTNQSITPPEAPEHSGYAFVRWEGGEYSNVYRSAAIYAIYAPARTVTVITPDEETINVNTYQGATLEDIAKQVNYTSSKKHYWFKCWEDANGNKLDPASEIIENATYTLCYTSTANGYLWGLAWYWYLAIAGALIIVGLVFVNR